jgi:Xaa-Pro aminopeptidase
METMGEGAVAIVPAAPERQRNRDIFYRYRQDSDLHYLTGFPEPEALVVLAPGRSQGEYILFCRESDEEAEIWHGRRIGLEGACLHYGCDHAFPIGDLDDIVPGLLEGRSRVYTIMGADSTFDQRLMNWVNGVRKKARAGIRAPDEFIALSHILHEMRLYKSRYEVKNIRRAVEISVEAHLRAMRACRPGMNEYELEAELEYAFRRGGSRYSAYPPIVGGGANGCILHYTENNAPLLDGDLVLIDAGAEFDGYAADITRSFPVSGRFSPAQREVYEVVLAAQAAAIEMVKPGNRWNDYHDAAIRTLTKGLVDLGILKGRVHKLIKDKSYQEFYMHRTGHWLGMDVHDVGDYKVDAEWRLLEPGMVLTVEPGLYLRPQCPGLAKRWWNIGIRIEDDVLVTRDGHDVLSAGAPKAVEEIEAIVGQGFARAA